MSNYEARDDAQKLLKELSRWRTLVGPERGNVLELALLISDVITQYRQHHRETSTRQVAMALLRCRQDTAELEADETGLPVQIKDWNGPSPLYIPAADVQCSEVAVASQPRQPPSEAAQEP